VKCTIVVIKQNDVKERNPVNLIVRGRHGFGSLSRIAASGTMRTPNC